LRTIVPAVPSPAHPLAPSTPRSLAGWRAGLPLLLTQSYRKARILPAHAPRIWPSTKRNQGMEVTNGQALRSMNCPDCAAGQPGQQYVNRLLRSQQPSEAPGNDTRVTRKLWTVPHRRLTAFLRTFYNATRGGHADAAVGCGAPGRLATSSPWPGRQLKARLPCRSRWN
jgi:hypothetical protein